MTIFICVTAEQGAIPRVGFMHLVSQRRNGCVQPGVWDLSCSPVWGDPSYLAGVGLSLFCTRELLSTNSVPWTLFLFQGSCHLLCSVWKMRVPCLSCLLQEYIVQDPSHESGGSFCFLGLGGGHCCSFPPAPQAVASVTQMYTFLPPRKKILDTYLPLIVYLVSSFYLLLDLVHPNFLHPCVFPSHCCGFALEV